MRITTNDQAILLLLQDIKDNKSPTNMYSPNQIVRIVGIPYSSVAASLRKLHLLSCVGKHSGGDNGGYRYSFKSSIPDAEAYRMHLELRKFKPPDLLENIQAKRLDYKDLLSLLGKWSHEKWEPKIFKSARNFPLSLSAIVELIVQMAYGSKVTNAELYDLRKPIEQFERDLQATLNIVQGILRDKRFQDPALLYAFLMSNGTPEQLQNLALKVKENN